MKSILKRENKQWRRRNFVIQTVMEFRPQKKSRKGTNNTEIEYIITNTNT